MTAASRTAMSPRRPRAACLSHQARIRAISPTLSAFTCRCCRSELRPSPRRTAVTLRSRAGEARFCSRYFRLIAASATRIVPMASGAPFPVVARGDRGSEAILTRKRVTSSGVAARRIRAGHPRSSRRTSASRPGRPLRVFSGQRGPERVTDGVRGVRDSSVSFCHLQFTPSWNDARRAPFSGGAVCVRL